ncbi:MAG: hypothetical protein JNK72_21490 [Myxococcales bacterium]|nr:hypothetical protein [Myxococcales bacterium]
MLVAVAAVTAACTGGGYDPSAPDGGEDVGQAAASARVSGVLFVEQGEGGREGAAVGVGARFVRVSGLRDEALPDLVGTPMWPLPRVAPGAAVRCVERGVDARAVERGAEVRLLDVGPIDLVAGERALRMNPRRFPDLWNVVSGVLYGVDSALPMGVWRFTSPGNPAVGVGAFDVSGASPEPLAAVTLNDLPLQGGAEATVQLPRRGGLALRWQRSPRAEEGDLVTVAFEGAGQMVCAARDEGALDLDAATLDRARELLREGGAVSVHRLRARPFVAPGVDTATLVFDLALRARAN